MAALLNHTTLLTIIALLPQSQLGAHRLTHVGLVWR